MKTLALFIAPLALVTLAFGQQMPDSPGRDLTDKVCSACHGTDNFSRNLVSKDDWEAFTVVIQLGAVLSVVAVYWTKF